MEKAFQIKFVYTFRYIQMEILCLKKKTDFFEEQTTSWGLLNFMESSKSQVIVFQSKVLKIPTFSKHFPMVDTLKQAGISSHRAEVNKKAVVHYLNTLHLTTSCINLCQYCKNRRLTLLLHQNTRLL